MLNIHLADLCEFTLLWPEEMIQQQLLLQKKQNLNKEGNLWGLHHCGLWKLLEVCEPIKLCSFAPLQEQKCPFAEWQRQQHFGARSNCEIINTEGVFHWSTGGESEHINSGSIPSVGTLQNHRTGPPSCLGNTPVTVTKPRLCVWRCPQSVLPTDKTHSNRFATSCHQLGLSALLSHQ